MEFPKLTDFTDKTCDVGERRPDFNQLPLELYRPPMCPRCRSMKIIGKGYRKNKQKGRVKLFRCNSCGYRFGDDPTVRSHFPLWVVSQVLELTVEDLRLKQRIKQIKREAELRNQAIKISVSSLPNIVKKYVKLLLEFENIVKPKIVSSEWIIDDTYEIFPREITGANWIPPIKSKRKMYKRFVWITNVIDVDTKYWFAGYVSSQRDADASENAIRLAMKRAKCLPQIFRCDGLKAHIDGIKKCFNNAIINSKTKKEDFTHINLLESLHSFMRRMNIKKRGKFRSLERLQYEVDLLRICWNFLPHDDLGESTPAIKAGIYPKVACWDELIRFAHSIVKVGLPFP